MEMSVVNGDIVAGASSTRPQDKSLLQSFNSHLMSSRGIMFSPHLKPDYQHMINQAIVDAHLHGASTKLNSIYADASLELEKIQDCPWIPDSWNTSSSSGSNITFKGYCCTNYLRNS